MLYLLLCILANVGIFICFREFKTYGLNTFQAIVFNYVTCVFTGIIFLGDFTFIREIELSSPWVITGLILGLVFIGTFYIMALTTQRFSLTVSSIASKLSLIIPVMISLLVINAHSKEYSIFNYIGMTIAVPAIIMSSFKKRGVEQTDFSGLALLLPLSVFILGGFIDSAINYISYHYLKPSIEPLFPIVIFTSSAVCGIVILIYRRSKIRFRNILGGVILGAINYFSIYFLIKTLSHFNNDGAVVYPLLNIGIILISAMLSVLVFKEHLSKINKTGLIMAILCIILISFEELIKLIQ